MSENDSKKTEANVQTNTVPQNHAVSEQNFTVPPVSSSVQNIAAFSNLPVVCAQIPKTSMNYNVPSTSSQIQGVAVSQAYAVSPFSSLVQTIAGLQNLPAVSAQPSTSQIQSVAVSQNYAVPPVSSLVQNIAHFQNHPTVPKIPLLSSPVPKVPPLSSSVPKVPLLPSPVPKVPLLPSPVPISANSSPVGDVFNPVAALCSTPTIPGRFPVPGVPPFNCISYPTFFQNSQTNSATNYYNNMMQLLHLNRQATPSASVNSVPSTVSPQIPTQQTPRVFHPNPSYMEAALKQLQLLSEQYNSNSGSK